MCFVLNIKLLPSHRFFKALKLVKNIFNRFGRFLFASFNIYLQFAIWSKKKTVLEKKLRKEFI